MIRWSCQTTIHYPRSQSECILIPVRVCGNNDAFESLLATATEPLPAAGLSSLRLGKQRNALETVRLYGEFPAHYGGALEQFRETVKSSIWIPGQARNDEFLEVPVDKNAGGSVFMRLFRRFASRGGMTWTSANTTEPEERRIKGARLIFSKSGSVHVLSKCASVGA